MVRPATYCDLLQNPRFVYIPTMNFKNDDFKRLFKMCFLNLSSKYHTPHSTRFFLYTQYYTIDMFFLHIKDPLFWKNRFYKGISWLGKSCHSTEFFIFPQVMNIKYFLQKSNYLLLMWSAKLFLDNFDCITSYESELRKKSFYSLLG